jgi:hypothetical protein
VIERLFSDVVATVHSQERTSACPNRSDPIGHEARQLESSVRQHYAVAEATGYAIQLLTMRPLSRPVTNHGVARDAYSVGDQCRRTWKKLKFSFPIAGTARSTESG